MEYRGELLTQQESEVRADQYSDSEKVFIFNGKEEHGGK